MDNLITFLDQFRKNGVEITKLLGWKGGNNFSVSYDAWDEGDLEIVFNSRNLTIDSIVMDSIRLLVPGKPVITFCENDEELPQGIVSIRYTPYAIEMSQKEK